MMLEALCHGFNSFWTLTYSEEELQRTNPNGSPQLSPAHVQNFLKRFRKKVSPLSIRFYAVGEYGEQTMRPHYHLALFGFPTCLRGRTNHLKSNCCWVCDLVKSSWGHGGVDAGDLTPASAAYLAGYVTKKMTRADDPRLNGLHPEFARMSLRPGIGALATDEVASAVLQLPHLYEDVPKALRHGANVWPLGRYLVQKIREGAGREKTSPQSSQFEQAEKLRAMQTLAFDIAKDEVRSVSSVIKDAIATEIAGRVAATEAKYQRTSKSKKGVL